jgi:hypothetical protein
VEQSASYFETEAKQSRRRINDLLKNELQNQCVKPVSTVQHVWSQHMGALALAIFVGLYLVVAGSSAFVSSKSDMQIILFLSFVLGIICGYRVSR